MNRVSVVWNSSPTQGALPFLLCLRGTEGRGCLDALPDSMKGGALALVVALVAVADLLIASLLFVLFSRASSSGGYDFWELREVGERWSEWKEGCQTCPKLGGRTVTFSDVQNSQVSKVKIEERDLVQLATASPKLNVTDARTRLVLQLVKKHTEGWEPLEEEPLRASWSAKHVRDAILSNVPLACCSHVRVVDGKVYFRYSFETLTSQYRLDRMNDLVSFLQATIDEFQLREVRVEFLFNTCDHAMSREAMAEGSRSNFLIWTPHVTHGLDADVVVPDLLDLRPAYMQSRQEMAEARERGPKWEEKVAKAVFRGATTNYWLKLSNWVSSPRIRLHRMSDGLGEVLDARVTRWSHVHPETQQDLQQNGSIYLAPKMNDTGKNMFKYEMVVDGGMGGGRLCGVLLTERALLLQSSPFLQFFSPLLKRGRHFMETDHYFRNLPETLAYMQSHDEEVRKMVETVHQELGWTCSIQGRMLAFAVLLVKYHSIQDPAFYTTGQHSAHSLEVQPPLPSEKCQWGPASNALLYRSIPTDWTSACRLRPQPRLLDMPGCPSDCSSQLLQHDWKWLSADDLVSVPGWDWWKSYIPET